MVVVAKIPSVHMIQRRLQFDADARSDTPMLVQLLNWTAQVSYNMNVHVWFVICSFFSLLDSCNINNGGCSANAMCSHDSVTYVAICLCKPGYTNVGSSSNVICTGQNLQWIQMKQDNIFETLSISDSCQVNNGGCETNAICSHDETTFAVICTCKIGFTNVGLNSNVTCQGMLWWNRLFQNIHAHCCLWFL